eukprot:TCALIF_05268-PA protein Name:"Similar to EIF4A2 Eukaryotic initiation factor 4A-II (Macaca fascicularis)" AED:0.13 eAED:0.13 QI:0/0/0/1/1/1/2/0/197
MNLRAELLERIHARGYERPWTIQQRVIPLCVQGSDLIVEAPSGSGKTVAFIIAVLQKINISTRECQALILAPNRELAQAIQLECMSLGESFGSQCQASIGGIPVLQEVQKLKAGTPGRVKHMILAKYLKTQNIKMLILHQADSLLPNGYKEEIYDMFERLNHVPIQVILLSATVSNELLNLAEKFMRHPIQISHMHE